MVDHEDAWPKGVTSIAHWRGTSLRSVKHGRAYIIICGSGACVRAAPSIHYFKFLIFFWYYVTNNMIYIFFFYDIVLSIVRILLSYCYLAFFRSIY